MCVRVSTVAAGRLLLLAEILRCKLQQIDVRTCTAESYGPVRAARTRTAESYEPTRAVRIGPNA